MTDHARSFQPAPQDVAGVVSWVHIGDLHMEVASGQNHADLRSIVAEINAELKDNIAFTFLPGDVADQGSISQYEVVRAALDELQVPWCAILGDHDVHERSFDSFLRFMSSRPYYDFNVGAVRFFALNAFDEPDPGSFALLPPQLTWLERGLQQLHAGEAAVLLLHCYPSDLKQGKAALEELTGAYPVWLIDMGHTHYNEIANDGRLLYTATRSTGQIEEGPVGFSITNIDGPAISWKFLPLNSLPAVMITSPADERLIPESRSPELVVGGSLRVRAKVFSAQTVMAVTAEVFGRSLPLERVANSNVYQAELQAPAVQPGTHTLKVLMTDPDGREEHDEIRIVVGRAAFQPPARRERDQDNAVEAWPERGLLATQLGPNKNGKKW